jgi:serine/threonine protein kinase
LEKTLGEGSFALVRLAHDNETKEKVAVKIIQRNRIAGKKEIYLYREVNMINSALASNQFRTFDLFLLDYIIP